MKCIDLFCGCGGLSLGFINAGIDVVASIDNWDKAVEVYKENFNHPCYLHDLKNEEKALEIINKHSPDMIIGGPPCQDFSAAGKRDETLGRADLTYNFVKIISSYRPQWFVMENVERIKKSHILHEVTETLINQNYGLTSIVLDASFCGVPQSRKRFFLIGELNGKHHQLNEIFLKNMALKPMTIRDYLNNSLGLEYYYRHPRNYSRRGIFSIDEPSPTVRGVNRPIPSNYVRHSGDPQSLNIKDIRPLTTTERSYLQTFPKNFKFQGSKTNLEQMIGNAVPVNLAKFVAQGILEYIAQRKVEKIQLGLFDVENFKIPMMVKTAPDPLPPSHAPGA